MCLVVLVAQATLASASRRWMCWCDSYYAERRQNVLRQVKQGRYTIFVLNSFVLKPDGLSPGEHAARK